MKWRLIILLLIFASTFSIAQEFPADYWHEGKVVLINNDTIRGELKYDLNRDIVQIKSRKGIEAFTAKKVLYFSFLDELSRQFRRFYALPFYITAEYKTPIFFEVFLQGKMTLLAREYVTVKTVNYGNASWSGNSYSRPVLAYHYYFLNDIGDIVRFHNKKKELYRIFRKKEHDIKQYVKNNRLRYDDKSDMIQLTDYYNFLVTPEQVKEDE